MLEDSAGEGRAEIVPRSENVAHNKRAEEDTWLRVTPVAEVHVEAGILGWTCRGVDHILRSREMVAARSSDPDLGRLVGCGCRRGLRGDRLAAGNGEEGYSKSVDDRKLLPTMNIAQSV